MSAEQKQGSQEEALGEIRREIDSIDRQIHSLLNARARCAQRVAEVKAAYDQQDAVFYRPEREAQVLREVMTRNEGPLADTEVARLFREVMSVCLALEQPMKVAFLGPEASFTQQAAYKHFGHSVKARAYESLEQVFRDVDAGTADYGVVPIENASEGVIDHALDLFQRFNLKICGEVELRTHQHLLVASESQDLQSIKRIYAHPFAFHNTHVWLEQNLAQVERVLVESNAQAAEALAAQPDGAAMIGGDIVSELFSLQLMAKNIEDEPDLTTRYLVIGNQYVGPSGQDKTSILAMARNQPGALVDLLEPFKRRQISLTRVESRTPKQGRWDSLFYIDFEGHTAERETSQLIAELEQQSIELKWLGSYPKAVL